MAKLPPNGPYHRRTGSLLNVTFSVIGGGDRAKRRLEPVRDFLAPHMPKIAKAVHCGIVEIDRMQDVARRENQRLTDDDLAQLALSLDENGDGRLEETTPERVFGLLRAVADGAEREAA